MEKQYFEEKKECASTIFSSCNFAFSKQNNLDGLVLWFFKISFVNVVMNGENHALKSLTIAHTSLVFVKTSSYHHSKNKLHNISMFYRYLIFYGNVLRSSNPYAISPN